MMFHRILTVLTTTAVAIHAILGCCAHHAHASCRNAQEITVAVSHGDPGDCQRGHEHGPSGKMCDHHGDHPHHGGEPCDEPDCSFFSTARGDDVTLAMLPAIWRAVEGDETASRKINAAWVHGFTVDHPPGPLHSAEPLHALIQVWLL